ncbi:MAG TPA: hypothetical protein VGI32_07020 [Steroidobacteraceae bacterium]
MHASSQIDRRGQDVRQASMISAWSRGRTAIHSSICRVSAAVVVVTNLRVAGVARFGLD